MTKAVSDKKPFFLWYVLMLPHSPHTPPERLLNKYRDKTDSIQFAKYWACVEWFDETCGQLLKYLDENKLRENTLVVYLADNGWIQDPNQDRYAARLKQSPYDGGLRLRSCFWPGRIQPSNLDLAAISLDLVPTIMVLVGEERDSSLPGINLLDAEAMRSRKAIFGECFTHNAVDIEDPASSLRFRWMVSGEYKLIVPNPANEPEAIVELYQLSQDPHELRNLAVEKPELVQQLQAETDKWWRP